MSIEDGDSAMSQGSRYPKLKLKAGDRTRMHFLTSGADDHIAAAQFHVFGKFADNNQRTIVCVRALTAGEDTCNFCEEGHQDLRNRFGVWVYVHSILHTFDNPDEEGEGWKSVEISVGEDRRRNVFQEEVGKALLLDMAAGKSRKWWKQFVGAYVNHGSNLQTHLYELHRIGGDVDSEYFLTPIKKLVIKPEHAEAQNEQPSIKEVFRESIRFGPSTSLPGTPSEAMGTDELAGGGEAASENGAGDSEELKPAEPAAQPEEADELL